MRRSDSERRSFALGDTDAAAIPLTPRRASAPPPLAHAVPPGTVLAGKYRVIRTIGQGGMGVVLAARHEELDVPVAVKLLAPELIAQPDAVGRFVREARAASRLVSKHVTRVHDIGTLESGEPYIVMEYLAGEDLAYHAKRHRLAVADLVDYVVQACDAIAEAHAAGIVHRDIKPANLFLSRGTGGERLVKVLDFGVSKFLDGHTGDVALTGTTTIVGSALYMSPEQMRSSKNVDHRTDIYALGACLYELTAGIPPYVADSFAELCAKVYTEEPTPLHTRRGDLPYGFEATVQKALAHDPTRRYQSVAELAQALSPFTYEATRERIRALLDEYAPGLQVLPVARAQPPSVSPGPIALDPKRVDDRPQALLPMWIVAVAALAFGGLAAAVVFAWPGSSGGREVASGQTQATPLPPIQAAARTPEAAALPSSPVAAAPNGSASTSPAASASASAAASSATASTPAPKAREAPRQNRGRAQPRSTPPPSPVVDDSAVSRPSGASTVNSDLSQVTCTQHLPDGTTRKVPCPD